MKAFRTLLCWWPLLLLVESLFGQPMSPYGVGLVGQYNAAGARHYLGVTNGGGTVTGNLTNWQNVMTNQVLYTNGLIAGTNISLSFTNGRYTINASGGSVIGMSNSLLVNGAGTVYSPANATNFGSIQFSANGFLLSLSSDSNGIYARSPNGYAVSGNTDTGHGVKGSSSDTGIGVEGASYNSNGVYGISTFGTGVNGYSYYGYGGLFESPDNISLYAWQHDQDVDGNIFTFEAFRDTNTFHNAAAVAFVVNAHDWRTYNTNSTGWQPLLQVSDLSGGTNGQYTWSSPRSSFQVAVSNDNNVLLIGNGGVGFTIPGTVKGRFSGDGSGLTNITSSAFIGNGVMVDGQGVVTNPAWIVSSSPSIKVTSSFYSLLLGTYTQQPGLSNGYPWYFCAANGQTMFYNPGDVAYSLLPFIPPNWNNYNYDQINAVSNGLPTFPGTWAIQTNNYTNLVAGYSWSGGTNSIVITNMIYPIGETPPSLPATLYMVDVGQTGTNRSWSDAGNLTVVWATNIYSHNTYQWTFGDANGADYFANTIVNGGTFNNTNLADINVSGPIDSYTYAVSNSGAGITFPSMVTSQSGFIGDGSGLTNLVNGTNGLATIIYAQSLTNGFVQQSITNGLATIGYVNNATNGLIKTNNILAGTNIVTFSSNQFLYIAGTGAGASLGDYTLMTNAHGEFALDLGNSRVGLGLGYGGGGPNLPTYPVDGGESFRADRAHATFALNGAAPLTADTYVTTCAGRFWFYSAYPVPLVLAGRNGMSIAANTFNSDGKVLDAAITFTNTGVGGVFGSDISFQTRTNAGHDNAYPPVERMRIRADGLICVSNANFTAPVNPVTPLYWIPIQFNGTNLFIPAHQ